MRVLQVGKYYPPHRGGIETVTYQMGASVPSEANGIHMDTLCFADGARCTIDHTRNGSVFIMGTHFTLFSMALSWKYVLFLVHRARDYDIVHVHFPNPLAALSLLLLPKRVKVVVHWHSDIVKQRYLEFLLRPITRALVARSTFVVAPTVAHFDSSPYSAMFSGKSRVLPFILDLRASVPIDVKVVSAIKRRFLGRKIVFAVGRHVPYKGLEFLIEASCELSSETVVLIAGTGPLTNDYALLISKLGLEERVQLLGRVSDAEQLSYYDACDVFCLPSVDRSEMFGLVQLEAMARGKPVVSTKLRGSGVPLVNSHGVTGLVVPPRDSHALAQALSSLLSDQEMYTRFAANCRTYIERDYSRSSTAECYRALYVEALGE